MQPSINWIALWCFSNCLREQTNCPLSPPTAYSKVPLDLFNLPLSFPLGKPVYREYFYNNFPYFSGELNTITS